MRAACARGPAGRGGTRRRAGHLGTLVFQTTGEEDENEPVNAAAGRISAGTRKKREDGSKGGEMEEEEKESREVEGMCSEMD